MKGYDLDEAFKTPRFADALVLAGCAYWG